MPLTTNGTICCSLSCRPTNSVVFFRSFLVVTMISYSSNVCRRIDYSKIMHLIFSLCIPSITMTSLNRKIKSSRQVRWQFGKHYSSQRVYGQAKLTLFTSVSFFFYFSSFFLMRNEKKAWHEPKKNEEMSNYLWTEYGFWTVHESKLMAFVLRCDDSICLTESIVHTPNGTER